MAFWSDITNTPEPLRQYRWYILFASDQKTGNLNNSRFALMEASKPEMEVTMSEHLLLNHTFKYPLIVKWKPITVKFVSARGDKSADDVSKTFDTIINYSGYRTPDQSQENHINKNDMVSSISPTIYIIQVDETGKEIEQWSLNNPLITNINYGTLNYSSEDMVQITVTINYDYATLTTTDASSETTQ